MVAPFSLVRCFKHIAHIDSFAEISIDFKDGGLRYSA